MNYFAYICIIWNLEKPYKWPLKYCGNPVFVNILLGEAENWSNKPHKFTKQWYRTGVCDQHTPVLLFTPHAAPTPHVYTPPRTHPASLFLFTTFNSRNSTSITLIQNGLQWTFSLTVFWYLTSYVAHIVHVNLTFCFPELWIGQRCHKVFFKLRYNMIYSGGLGRFFP